MRPQRLTLEELDAIPYKSETGSVIQSKFIEREEQLDAQQFIPTEAIVLELGGRYGLAAAVINHQLENPLAHVVVEPDPTVQEALQKNRDSHLCHYSIFQGVVSRKPMYFTQKGFCSFCSDVPTHTPVESLPLEKLMERYGIQRFTHLVADCEGGVMDFFVENKEFLKTLEGIYFEKDHKPNKQIDYAPFLEYMKDCGFVQKKSGFREFWAKKIATESPY